MEFDRPLYLLLLPPLAYYTCRLARRSLADMSTFKRRLGIALRMAIIIMLVLALAGARMVRGVGRQCVVFVMDVSDSIPKARQDQALAYINRAIKSMKRDQKAGLVVFGGDACVELSPASAARVEKVYSTPSTAQTDISQALGLAMALFPEQCEKKIVLLSDGNETAGKAIEQAMLAGSDNVSIDTVPVSSDLPREVLIDKMICPSNLKVGEPFDIKVVCVAKTPSSGRIRILRDGAPSTEKAVDLPAGKSVFTFGQSIAKAGSYRYTAVLESADDTRAENNVATAYTMVHGKPRVLYLEGLAGQEKYLTQALRSSDIEIDARNRSGLPASLADLRGYDALVLSDIPAWQMSPDQMSMIRSAVRDLGIGLTMVGGENSFGAGGYFDTPIEEALPVDMSVRKKKIMPSLSVVIVMDKSGSMGMVEDGREKIELADDAAASVVRLLQPIDQVGVIVCHDFPVVAVSLRPALDKGPIYHEISTIRAEGGGIMVAPSVKMAKTMIESAKTRQRHVILLADGNDCDEPEGTVEMARQMANEKITVTTVAFGDGKDVDFLKAVAAAGKGYYYIALKGRDIKAIFTKDVMEVSKSLIVEEPFVPRLNTASPELSGIDQASVPPLLGYVTTSAKPEVAPLAVSHKNDPILATWQYGLGKSAAFTSDCKARWSARWLTWPGYGKIWAQVIRSTMRKSANGDFQTTVDVDGGVGRVVIDAVDEKGNFLNLLKFGGSVVGPDMKARPMTIDQTGPGRYEASFDAREVGNYIVNVGRKDKAGAAPEANVVSVPYPPEYKDIQPNTALLRRLASQTGGKFDGASDSIFGGTFRPARARTDLWQLLTLIAILLLPVDIAVRRLTINSEQAEEIGNRLLELTRERRAVRRKRKAAVTARSETMSALLKTRKRDTEDSPPTTISIKPPVATPSAKPAAPPSSPEPKASEDTASRLLEAKKRAREKKE